MSMNLSRFSHYRVFDKPAEDIRESAVKYGLVCLVLAGEADGVMRPVHYLNGVIHPAVDQGNIRFFFDENGLPIGYIVFAYLAEDVEERFFKTGIMALHASEWNEGESLWIVDMNVRRGRLADVLEKAFDAGLNVDCRVSYFREKNGRLLVKELSLQRLSSRTKGFGQKRPS